MLYCCFCLSPHNDWFPSKMSTFSTCALILWYQKWAHKCLSQILVFHKLNNPVQNLLFGLCIGIFLSLYYKYLRCKRHARFGFYGFCFFPISPFLIFISQKSSQFVRKYLCGPLINMGPMIKK